MMSAVSALPLFAGIILASGVVATTTASQSAFVASDTDPCRRRNSFFGSPSGTCGGIPSAVTRTTTTTATTTTSGRVILSDGPVVRTRNAKNGESLRLWFGGIADRDDEDYDDEDYDDEDDDDADDPLARGVDSVSWLPSVLTADGGGVTKSNGDIMGDDVKLTVPGSEILPLFPLGGIVYTPNSEHVLNIFEPRYRQMYSDILMNGSKKFAVTMSHPSQSGRFASTAVLFELEDLKEVSEQTGDQIKYICNHKVTGRVKIHRVLNPTAWQTQETYMRVEATVYDDSGKEENAVVTEDNPSEQRSLRSSFQLLVDAQQELEENVRFTRASASALAVRPGPGKDGLWQTVKLWQSFAEQRLISRQQEMQSDFQERLQSFLRREMGYDNQELPSSIGFGDLSPALREEAKELQKRMAMELRPLVLESTLTMQKILEAPDHTGRLKLIRHFVEAETKRLNTKKTIKGMFSGASSGGLSSSSSSPATSQSDSRIPPEEQISKEEEDAKRNRDRLNKNIGGGAAGGINSPNGGGTSSSSSIFTDDEDAFQ